jgi:hypothetical protein
MFTRETIEKALDAGRIEVLMATGRWWKARRSGMTKTWKTRPYEFRIPIKMGLREHSCINQDNMNSLHIREIQL